MQNLKMCANILPRILVPLYLIAGPNPNAWNINCNAGQDSKSQEARDAALLHAHRCYIKDVPIPIPAPLNTIPDIIMPSHVVVPRCKGKEYKSGKVTCDWCLYQNWS